MKNLLKVLRMDIVAVILAFLSLVSLFLTIMVPAETIEAGSKVTALPGLHLWEFTPAGFVLMAAPCVVIIMSRLHTKMQNKHLILFISLMLALIGYNSGIIAGSDWICSMTGGTVHYEKELVAYPILLLMSVGILVVHMDFADFLNEYEKEFGEYPESDEAYLNFYGR